MKIKKYIVLVFSLCLLLAPLSSVNAAAFTVSANKSAQPNSTVFVGVNFAGEGKFTISVQNGSGGGTFWYGDQNGANVKVGASGVTTVTVTAVDAVTNDLNPVSGSVTVKINVATPPPAATPKPQPKPEVPQETEAEKQARIEREEAAAREAAAKIPLITKIELLSDSDKRRDSVLSSFAPVEGSFDFEYSLPTFLEDIKFKIESVEGASITVEDTYKISEQSEIIIKASKGEINQEYKIKLTPDASVSNSVDGITVYSDSLLNSKMEEFGFTVVDVETVAGASKAFSKGSLVLQLIVDSGRSYEFQRLSEDGKVIDNGQLIIADGKSFFVSTKTTEEVTDYTLYGDGLQTVNLELPQYISEIDETLSVKANLQGWLYEDGVVLQGSDESGNIDFIRIDKDENVNKIVVAFDKDSTSVLPILFVIVSALLIAVTSTFAYYVLKDKKKHKELSAY